MDFVCTDQAGGWGDGPTQPLHEISFQMHEALAAELGITSYRKLKTLQVNTLKKGKTQASWQVRPIC
jgi:hypothetical protein